MAAQDFKISYTWTVNPEQASTLSQPKTGASSTILYDAADTTQKIGAAGHITGLISALFKIGAPSTIFYDAADTTQKIGASAGIPAEYILEVIIPKTIYNGVFGSIDTVNLSATDKEDLNEITIKGKSDSAWINKGYRGVYENTASTTVLISDYDSGKIFTNSGASAIGLFTLPSAAQDGVEFTFIRVASFGLRVQPASGHIVYSGGEMVNGKYLELASNGATITVVSDGQGNWLVLNERGTLTEEV